MRHESDLLGSLTLPDEAPFGVRTARLVNELNFSGRTLADYPLLIAALLRVKKAAALANGDAGVIPALQVARITATCDALLKDAPAALMPAGESWRQAFVVDAWHGGGSIGFNVNINEVITNVANKTNSSNAATALTTKDVNASQSTADVCATAFRLALVEAWTPLNLALSNLVKSWQAQSRAWQNQETLARTCMQDAMPVSMGSCFGGYASLLDRRLQALVTSVAALQHTNLGGTVIGSGEGATPAYRASILARFNQVIHQAVDTAWSVPQDFYDAAQNGDDLGDLGADLKALAEALLKIAHDLRLLSSGPHGGLGEIELPAVIEGSSFFPGKINPVVPETVIQGAVQVIGLLQAANLAAQQRELNLNVFEGQTALNCLDAVQLLTRIVALFDQRCVQGLKVQRERCDQLVATWRAQQKSKS